MTPRCGRPMLGYEAVHGALPESPACGRPEGHGGPCRSVLALERSRGQERVRQRRWRRSRRLHARLGAVVELAAAQAGERSRAA